MEKKVLEKLGWFLIVMSTIGLILCAASSFAWETIPTRGQIKASHITEIRTAHDALATTVINISASVSAIIASGTPAATSRVSADKWVSVGAYPITGTAISSVIASDGFPITLTSAGGGHLLDATFAMSGNGGKEIVLASAASVAYWDGAMHLVATDSASFTCGIVTYDWYDAYSMSRLYYFFGQNFSMYSFDEMVSFEMLDPSTSYPVSACSAPSGKVSALTASGTIEIWSWDSIATTTPAISSGTPEKIAGCSKTNVAHLVTTFRNGSNTTIFKIVAPAAFTSTGYSSTQVATSATKIHDVKYCGDGLFLATLNPENYDATSSIFLYSEDYGGTWSESDLKFNAAHTGDLPAVIAVGNYGEIVLSFGGELDHLINKDVSSGKSVGER